jgi:hypothetical protein
MKVDQKLKTGTQEGRGKPGQKSRTGDDAQEASHARADRPPVASERPVPIAEAFESISSGFRASDRQLYPRCVPLTDVTWWASASGNSSRLLLPRVHDQVLILGTAD